MLALYARAPKKKHASPRDCNDTYVPLIARGTPLIARVFATSEKNFDRRTQIMRALGASERVMSIIASAEPPTAAAAATAADGKVSGQPVGSNANFEIAGGAELGESVAGHVIFKVRCDILIVFWGEEAIDVLGGTGE